MAKVEKLVSDLQKLVKQHEALGKKISALGIPCFACTPDRLPELVEMALKAERKNLLTT